MAYLGNWLLNHATATLGLFTSSVPSVSGTGALDILEDMKRRCLFPRISTTFPLLWTVRWISKRLASTETPALVTDSISDDNDDDIVVEDGGAYLIPLEVIPVETVTQSSLNALSPPASQYGVVHPSWTTPRPPFLLHSTTPSHIREAARFDSPPVQVPDDEEEEPMPTSAVLESHIVASSQPMSPTRIVVTREPSVYSSRPATPTRLRREPATVDGLPVEIMGEIFALYLLNCEASSEQKRSSRLQTRVSVASGSTVCPTILASVSRRWNVIATTTTALWSTIYIDNPRPRDLPRIRKWFGRSESRPLNVSLVLSSEKKDESQEATRLVMAQSRRWKSVFFVIPHTVKDLCARFIDVPLCLEEFKIDLKAPKNYHWTTQCTTAFANLLYSSPCLRSAQWGAHVRARDVLPRASVAYAELRSLKMVQADAVHLLPVLAACTELQSLEIKMLSDSGYNGPVVSVPSLKHLSVDSVDNTATFRSLHLPGLSSLKLDKGCFLREVRMGPAAPAQISWHDPQPLVHLLARSQCCLTSLRLKWSPPIDHHLEEQIILWHLMNVPQFASLQHLDLGSPVGPNTVWALTMSVLGGEGRCPDLKTVRFGHCQGSLREDLLEMMLNSRPGMSERDLTAVWHGPILPYSALIPYD